jgi:pimeloyl-ACP methyl ester carboxylesterase
MAQPKRSSDHRSSRGGRQKTPARSRPAAAASQDPVTEEITLHGHRVSFRRAGWGPAILLIHGVAGSSETWSPVIDLLAEKYTVIAPDLIGHGESAKPRGDYSLGAYASGIRDLLQAIGHDRVTVVGHSLGGGVAMQMAYQFPERCERLVLVSSGGLGREVSFLLRAATLPGSEWVIPLLASRRVLDAGDWFGGMLGRVGVRASSDVDELWRGLASLHDAGARKAFVYTLRSIVEAGGQRVSARDRLYLAKEMPTLIMWGESDRIIPVRHGAEAAESMEAGQFETFPGAGHFPHRDDPVRFAKTLDRFIQSTEPSSISEERRRELLREGE